jgi:hypothetical protein
VKQTRKSPLSRKFHLKESQTIKTKFLLSKDKLLKKIKNSNNNKPRLWKDKTRSMRHIKANLQKIFKH